MSKFNVGDRVIITKDIPFRENEFIGCEAEVSSITTRVSTDPEYPGIRLWILLDGLPFWTTEDRLELLQAVAPPVEIILEC